mgnify:FL=1
MSIYSIEQKENNSPLHEHDCSYCIYVGSYKVEENGVLEGNYDIYYHYRHINNDNKNPMVSLIARWSSKCSNYYSYPFFKTGFHNALEYLIKQWEKHDYFPTKLCSFGWLKFVEDFPEFKDYPQVIEDHIDDDK